MVVIADPCFVKAYHCTVATDHCTVAACCTVAAHHYASRANRGSVIQQRIASQQLIVTLQRILAALLLRHTYNGRIVHLYHCTPILVRYIQRASLYHQRQICAIATDGCTGTAHPQGSSSESRPPPTNSLTVRLPLAAKC